MKNSAAVPPAHVERGECMFDLLAERKKTDRIVRQVTTSSLRFAGLMVLAIMAIAGLSFVVLFLRQ